MVRAAVFKQVDLLSQVFCRHEIGNPVKRIPGERELIFTIAGHAYLVRGFPNPNSPPSSSERRTLESEGKKITHSRVPTDSERQANSLGASVPWNFHPRVENTTEKDIGGWHLKTRVPIFRPANESRTSKRPVEPSENCQRASHSSIEVLRVSIGNPRGR